jgi:hypothetical protein
MGPREELPSFGQRGRNLRAEEHAEEVRKLSCRDIAIEGAIEIDQVETG